MISILIANYEGHEAVELCVESILKRTRDTGYKIIVLDSSPEDSRDKAYLRKQKWDGNIGLIESERKLGHGAALTRLLRRCDTPLACLLDSDCEILQSDWLSLLAVRIKHADDLGVARFRHGGVSVDFQGIAPVYWPCVMLLNVSLYRSFEGDTDWQQNGATYADYKYKKIFDKPGYTQNGLVITRPGQREIKHKNVARDTAWRFTEKVLFETGGKYRIHPMPHNYWEVKVKHYGGITRNHFRPEHPVMKPRWEMIKKNLARLRREGR